MNALNAAILAGRELAWQPHSNLRPRAFAERRRFHENTIDKLLVVGPLPDNADPILVALIEAMHRLVACSFANRRGVPYYERKQSFAELRGCLLAYDRAMAEAAA